MKTRSARAFKTKTKYLPAGDLTDDPTMLLNKYVGNKRTHFYQRRHLKMRFGKSWIIHTAEVAISKIDLGMLKVSFYHNLQQQTTHEQNKSIDVVKRCLNEAQGIIE